MRISPTTIASRIAIVVGEIASIMNRVVLYRKLSSLYGRLCCFYSGYVTAYSILCFLYVKLSVWLECCCVISIVDAVVFVVNNIVGNSPVQYL